MKAIYLDGQRLSHVKDYSEDEGWVEVHVPVVVADEPRTDSKLFLLFKKDGSQSKPVTVRVNGKIEVREENPL